MRSPTSSCLQLRANLQRKGTYIGMASRRLSKEFGLKSYKTAAKPRLMSARKRTRLSFANKHLYWTVEKMAENYFLTNPQLSNSQCERGTFENQNVINAKYTTSKVKQPLKPDGLRGCEQTRDCWAVLSSHQEPP